MFHTATGMGEKNNEFKSYTMTNFSLAKLTQLPLVRHCIAYTVSDRPSRKSTLSPRRPQRNRHMCPTHAFVLSS